MHRLLARFLAPVFVALCALGLSGCADDFGESCQMPTTTAFEVACGSDDDGNEGTCLFRNSPDCSTRLCGRYQGVGDFCTESCDVEDPASCPDDAICYAAANRAANAFCIPRDVYEEAEGVTVPTE